jgi:hypothetical protein
MVSEGDLASQFHFTKALTHEVLVFLQEYMGLLRGN